MKSILFKIALWFDEWGTTLLIIGMGAIAWWFIDIIKTGNFPNWMMKLITG